MKVLATGATGFVGKSLSQHLLSEFLQARGLYLGVF